MDKPKLTAEQAKALEALRNVWSSGGKFLGGRQIIKEKLDGGWTVPDFAPANSIDDDDFIAALYIGYEIEQSPEEKLREYYVCQEQSYHDSVGTERIEHLAKVVAIRNTLAILGIQIEGINA
ncbi:hypothetical protein MKX29_24350 [Cytobacillus sp. FSL R7-0696]|uniref:hypothetical protein n=1 Tax=Cytobacillus sp. FSL R7-0696 TaxID=2921691 RepID=UPI0030F9DB60